MVSELGSICEDEQLCTKRLCGHLLPTLKPQWGFKEPKDGFEDDEEQAAETELKAATKEVENAIRKPKKKMKQTSNLFLFFFLLVEKQATCFVQHSVPVLISRTSARNKII